MSKKAKKSAVTDEKEFIKQPPIALFPTAMQRIVSFFKPVANWFKARPLENVSNTYQSLQETFQAVTSGLKNFTPVLNSFAALPIVGMVLQGISTLFKSITVIFDKEASLGSKLFAIAVDVILLTLAALGVGFAAASFSFAFGLAAAGLGLVGAGIGLFNAINGWYQAKNTLEKVKNLEKTETLEEKTTRLARLEELQNELNEHRTEKFKFEAEIFQLEKTNPNDPKIKTLKAELKEVNNKISIAKAAKETIDTSAENIKKLTLKTANARTGIFSSLVGTGLAAAGVIAITLVVVTAFTAPALLPVVGLAAAAIGLGAGIIGLVYSVANRIFEQRDKDAKAEKKANKAKHSNAVVIEALHKNTTTVPQTMSLNTDKTSIDNQLSNDEHKKSLLKIIKLFADTQDMSVSNLTQSQLSNIDVDNLKLICQEQIEKARPATIDQVSSNIHTNHPELVEYYGSLLKETGKLSPKPTLLESANSAETNQQKSTSLVNPEILIPKANSSSSAILYPMISRSFH